VLAAAMAVVAILSACAGKKSATTKTGANGVTTTTTVNAESSWGTLTDVCKPGTATFDEKQNGGGGALNVGTATDKSSTIVPGLLQEMWDASRSFVKWCNAQGGIQGIKLNLVDLDAALFNAKPMIKKACSSVFSMVGGGATFDDQEFPEFHQCKMVDIAGFTVTAAKAMSNGFVQPIPNPSNDKPATWLIESKEQFKTEVAKPAIVYGDFLTTANVAKQLKEQLGLIGGYGEPAMISFPSVGVDNWAPYAQQLKDKGTTWFTFVGTPQQLAKLYQALDQIDFHPQGVFETNHYDQSLIDIGGKAVEGAVARLAYHPFEEADRWPAIKKYLDELRKNVAKAHVGGLGVQSTSAWLMFVTAANGCLADNKGVLERECLVAHAAKITDWTGGGLQAVTHPNTNLPPVCNVLMVVKGGKWTRLFPTLGSPQANADGFDCREQDGVTHLAGDYGKGVIDPGRPIFFANEK
jgi:hypothetical protein